MIQLPNPRLNGWIKSPNQSTGRMSNKILNSTVASRQDQRLLPSLGQTSYWDDGYRFYISQS